MLNKWSRRSQKALRFHLPYFNSSAIVCVFPFLWMISTSFKTMSEVYRMPPTFIPHNPTLANYSDGWAYADFTAFTRNTILVAVTATIGTVISSSFVAYGFARFKSRLSGFLTTVLLGTMMLLHRLR